jgi:hypothetical protein
MISRYRRKADRFQANDFVALWRADSSRCAATLAAASSVDFVRLGLRTAKAGFYGAMTSGGTRTCRAKPMM